MDYRSRIEEDDDGYILIVNGQIVGKYDSIAECEEANSEYFAEHTLSYI